MGALLALQKCDDCSNVQSHSHHVPRSGARFKALNTGPAKLSFRHSVWAKTMPKQHLFCACPVEALCRSGAGDCPRTAT